MRKGTLAAGLLTLTALFSGSARAMRSDRDVASGPAVELARQHVQALQTRRVLPPESEFVARRVDDDQLGQSHVRIDQLYRGVPVFGGELIVHVDLGDARVVSVTDASIRVGDLETTPGVAAGDAVLRAHRELAPLGAYVREPEAELVVFETDAGDKVLAYHVHTELENRFETRHTDFMIDARTGALLTSWDSLETGAAVGSGSSQYSGTVSLNANSITGGYELRDLTRGSGGNTTRNLNHATSGTGSIYTGADDAWGDGKNYVEGSSTTAANGETAGVDAHYGLQKTWDYYKTTHGRNGIDNAGTATYSRVHYSNSYDNAFWSDSCFCMTYGDGSSFTTLTSIDVAGHEMTHGVTARTAGLQYRRESGGINESTSDIFGEMVEAYAKGSADYKIGEQLSAKPLRYMYKPSLDGGSADCWSSNVGNLDVHYSSGVGNHFYYLLVNGGGPGKTSPTCNGLTVTGIGRAAAEKIYYRALTVYMSARTDYAGARAACLSAAADLYGATSANRNAVAAAWSAVSVN